MNKDLIINSSPEGVEIALLEEKKLVEIHNEKIDARWSVDRKSTRLNSSHMSESRMPSSA